MQIKNYILPLILFIVTGFSSLLYGGTTITGNSDITSTGLTEVINQFQTISDQYGPALADAYALGNIGGYPLGTAILESFPHMFVGISINAGLTNLIYFNADASAAEKENKMPGFGLNPVIFFGMGLGGGLDIIGKFLVFNDGFYKPPFGTSFFTLDALTLYSVGGKIRYNFIAKKTIMPGIFNFNGLTFTAGGDFLKGNIGFSGAYRFDLPSIQVNVPPIQIIDVYIEPDYVFDINWWIVSTNLQALAYVEIFFIFDFYSGFGAVFNFGSFDYNFRASGDAKSDAALTLSDTLTIESINKYSPSLFMPTFILGCDINIKFVRISIESMVNLWNRKDINLQVGLRFQY